MRRALDIVARGLRWEGFDAYIPKEPGKGVHLDIHIRAKNIAHAAKEAQRLQRLYGAKVKKRFANGTHLLYMPHLIAVSVDPK